MEKSFDFGALLKNHEKKHKNKPMQFISVAGGVNKRLENNLKHRKSSRLTIFDSIRNLSRCSSPTPSKSEAQMKVEHRRQQLEKWKEEKERKKKEAATQKKKPFITGVPHAPLKFVPPPPPPKPWPSTSGRVTRSQTARNKVKEVKESKQSQKTVKDTKHKTRKEIKQSQSQSFAPKNASFKAPQIKNLTKLPSLAPIKTTKDKHTITFDPIIHTAIQEVKQTRKQPAAEPRVTQTKPTQTRTRCKVIKPVTKQISKTVQSSSRGESMFTSKLQSSSSSDNDFTVMQTSSNSENDSKLQSTSSSETESLKSIQHTFSSESEPAESLQSTSSSEIEEKESPILTNKSRKSRITRKSTPRTSSTPRKTQTNSKSPGKSDSKFLTPKNPVPKSESSSEERLRSPKSPIDVPMTPEQIAEEAKKISPCVTMSRGKDNARREMKKKLEEGLLDEDAADIDSIGHFRRQLASEIKRMTETCDTWDKISDQNVLPEPVQDSILGAVGQARLLMSQKLQQFATLVERCARPEPGASLVTPADLAGFWDMVFMQVENVDMRFKKLEELKARNWIEEEPVQVKRKVVKPVAKPAAKPAAKAKAGGPSRLREMIAAARKAKQQEEQSPFSPRPPPAAADKTFEAGFFCVRSPVRSPRAPRPSATPNNKHNLLKAVLSSETQKASASRNSASFAMLRASVLGKNIDCDGVAPLPQSPLQQVNLLATPGRSILKQAQDNNVKSGNKPIKVVLFDQSDNESDTSITVDKENKQEQVVRGQEQAVKDMDLNISLPSIEKEKEKDKENSRRKSKLVRQDATDDWSPVMTRSRRKSLQTPQADEKTPRSRKKKVLEEVEDKVGEKQTPKRSTRRRKSALQEVN